ncbi:RNA polymerase sigma factor [Capsulimonas corticalis]|uniref:RNA polymerase sigma factor n=1 Tax=Capsulimonas corticalis TaxID=2219043 RepID=A0A402CPR9_9BACT|nr:sigma-70 family RNA polymerase sigma factor [Capsulimonas corticalis]BDI32947.1 RNA polymerase sigma factor [Capsulimonas corticalis]
MTTTTEAQNQQHETLVRAQRGDRKAFSRLMEPYRRELVAYCYRHVGSLAEAEDIAQEAFVRAYRAMETFEGRATPRAWLYKIAHNLSINHVQRRPSWESLADSEEAGRVETSIAAERAGQGREDVRLGFVALIQSLPPRQRAALVLRDVLGWSAEEAAQILGTTVPAVKNALARARQTLASLPHGDDPANVSDLAARDPEARDVVAQWADAFEKGNTARMVELLTEPQALQSPKTTVKNPRATGLAARAASQGKNPERVGKIDEAGARHGARQEPPGQAKTRGPDDGDSRDRRKVRTDAERQREK